jgi:two-component system phosphate regulon sensor histidine kinase PhoR
MVKCNPFMEGRIVVYSMDPNDMSRLTQADPETGPEPLLTPQRKARPISVRLRDGLVAGGLAGGVFALLALSGTLSFGVAITAFLLFALALAAYGVSVGAGVAGRAQANAAPSPETSVTEPADNAEWQDFLDSFLTGLPLSSFVLDQRLRLIKANPAALALMRSAPGAGGQSVSALVRRPDLLRMIEQAGRDGLAGQIEIVFPGATDQVFLALVRPLRLPGQTGVLVVFEDRTAVRRAERARADFLANASHELRTPLASLAGFIETMRGPAKDDKASWDRFLEIMYGQTERMRRLIHDLLSLSRIELNEHTVPDSIVDLGLIAREAVEALQPQAQQVSRRIVYEGPAEGLFVIGSRDELAQVAQNLIDNALKYSPAGAAVVLSTGAGIDGDAARAAAGRQWTRAERITITQAPDALGRRYAWLRVRDSGAGIPTAALPRLGERFYRVDESRGGKVGGTGLGLAIVKHIMARHRGGLVVESLVGEGAAFGIWLAQPEPDPTEARLAAQ